MKLDKRKIFILICIVIVVIIAAIILIANLGKKTTLDGEGIPTKAYYTQSGKDIKVVLKKTSDKNYYWVATPEKTDYVKIEDKSDMLSNVYIVSKDAENVVVSVDFDLVNKEDANEILYKVTIDFNVDDNGKVTVINTAYEAFEAILKGEIAGIQYSIVNESEGYAVYIEDLTNEWKSKKSSKLLFVDGPSVTEGKNRFSIKLAEIEENNEDVESNEATVTIYSEALLKKLVVNVKADENMKLSITSSEVQDYEIPKVLSEEAQEEFVNENGEIKLPDAAEKIEYKEDSVDFVLNDKEMSLEIYGADADEADFLGNLADAQYTKKTATLNETALEIYAFDEDSFMVATWKTEEKLFVFSGYDMDENTFMTILKELI